MKLTEISGAVVNEIAGALSGIDEAQAERLIEAVMGARRVFVAAAGRSLLMIRSFAMRLMQIGLTSYVVGETVTPAITPDDLLVIASGSGETATLSVIAAKAKKVGARLAVITTAPASTIASAADAVVTIPAYTPKGAAGGASVQPGASTFEQSVLIFGDSVVIEISSRLGLGKDTDKKLMSLHANME